MSTLLAVLTAEGAGKQLARLIEKQLSYEYGHIDHVALRLFIRVYWSQVSALAHVILDEDQLKTEQTMKLQASEYGQEKAASFREPKPKSVDMLSLNLTFAKLLEGFVEEFMRATPSHTWTGATHKLHADISQLRTELEVLIAAEP